MVEACELAPLKPPVPKIRELKHNNGTIMVEVEEEPVGGYCRLQMLPDTS